MGSTTRKGEIGEAMVLADLQRKGYAVAIPFGHDVPFDLVLIRRSTGSLERVQCKYTVSDGRALDVRCGSSPAWVRYTYTADQTDWIAVYDATTDCCYYLHSSTWAGLARPRLRLAPAANGQQKGLRWGRDFLYPEPAGRPAPAADDAASLAMLGDSPPE